MPRGCAIALLAATSVFGALLALVAMAFIVVNETQVDLAKIARESRLVHPDEPSAPTGELVSLTGTIAVDGTLGDDMFLVPGTYLRVERIVEIYAWEKFRQGEDANGKPRYKQRRVWTRSPESMLGNPRMPFKGTTVTASSAHIGEVRITPQAAELPSAENLPLTKELLLPGVDGRIQEGYLYIGSGSISRPSTGDLRVSYFIVPDRQFVTVFASLDGTDMVPYQAADGRGIYKVMVGDRETALRDLGAIQVIAAWMVRLVASGSVWFGLLLLFYGSRRLVDWPKLIGISIGSVRLASVLGLSTVILSILGLWLSQGNMLVLGVILAAEVAAACAWLVWQRTRPQIASPSMSV